MTSRRAFLGGLAAILATPALAASPYPLTVTDIAGNRVTLAKAPRRILLGDSLLFTALSLVDPDIDQRIVLMDSFVKRYDQEYFSQLKTLYPHYDAIPLITQFGSGYMETALETQPDLVILSLWQKGTTQGAVAQFTAMGVPVAFVDLFVDPIAHTSASMELLGALLGQPAAGQAYARFHAEHLRTIRNADLTAHPESVMLQVYPGITACCWVAGGAGFGQYIPLAGGKNIEAGHMPGAFGGALSLEFVLSADPHFYIATGLANPDQKTGVTIGFGIDEKTAQATLARTLAAPDIASIPAVQAHRNFALWNFLNGSPLNVLAIEAMAGWFHPDLAKRAGIDANASLDQVRDEFLHRNLTGTLWIAEEAA
ncbi:ABC transporter substrate-binding protein [Acidisoma cellulosilytica]|uniref:ABC transporter substrate-binding protein n=1 Tax=Acidisoma cellulosilyticum TaxID=2802395 RepID=A0A964E5N4_9PROT|nr:ABC transporter substrate-binding protein [Acidisoma cellulosilyticum]MCB8882870.1 ABC transporter substrate-binding protein [Acidisoma cellulosilyticum]